MGAEARLLRKLKEEEEAQIRAEEEQMAAEAESGAARRRKQRQRKRAEKAAAAAAAAKQEEEEQEQRGRGGRRMRARGEQEEQDEDVGPASPSSLLATGLLGEREREQQQLGEGRESQGVWNQMDAAHHITDVIRRLQVGECGGVGGSSTCASTHTTRVDSRLIARRT